MRVEDINKILGDELPKAMEVCANLERSITPFLSVIQQNRGQIDPALLAKLDEVNAELNAAKNKLKNHGNFDS
jgi:hypothetical protein